MAFYSEPIHTFYIYLVYTSCMLEDIIGKIQIKDRIIHNNIGSHLLLTHYDKIKSLRPYKDPINMTKWDEVISTIIESINLSKDLNLAAWLIEALAHRYNIKGFYAGIKILKDLITTFPDCYPQDKKKQEETISWIRENFAFWLKEEEVFPEVYFRQIHQNIQMGKMDNKIILSINIGKEELNIYIENKQAVIGEIKTHIQAWKIPLLDPLEKQILSFLVKLENFYNSGKEINHRLEKNKVADVTELPKDQIYNQINSLVETGLKTDPHDLLLYLIQKILIVRGKNNAALLMKIIKDNSIDGLLNS